MYCFFFDVILRYIPKWLSFVFFIYLRVIIYFLSYCITFYVLRILTYFYILYIFGGGSWIYLIKINFSRYFLFVFFFVCTFLPLFFSIYLMPFYIFCTLFSFIYFLYIIPLPPSLFFLSLLTSFSFSAQDLRVNRPWERWPAHLALPMILMRESMKKSMIQSITSKVATELSPSSSSSKSPKFQQRTSIDGTGFDCSVCGRIYKLKSSLRNHQKWECGKEPQFKCPYCVYKAKQKMHMARHMERMHKEIDFSAVKAELGIKNEPEPEAE